MSYARISYFLYLISFRLINLVMNFKEEVMTRPRNQQVSLESTSYYYCMACVRLAFARDEGRPAGCAR